jgi:tetratricopeptide (TPR) repeat protein
MTRGLVLGLWIGVASVAIGAVGPGRAIAEVDSREMQAREAFGAGRYQEALDGFVKLYAERLHPNYLRNIGRCYQNLGDPDKAISSFREYLRKAKGVHADERAEIEGYIKEMEDLKKQREAAATAPPPPVARPIEPLAQPVAMAPPRETPPSLTLTQAPAASIPPGQEATPVYKTWWFWTIIGAVAVGAGIGVAAAAGAFKKTQDAPCVGTCGG